MLIVVILSGGCAGISIGVDSSTPSDSGLDSGPPMLADSGTDAGPAPIDGGADAGPAMTDGGSDAGEVPLYHRPSDSQCLQTPGPGTCDCNSSEVQCTTDSEFMCIDDAQCADAGTNGRCAGSVGPAGCFCTHDACMTGADCGAGATCACHGSPFVYGFGNSCVPANCHVDSDCGTAGYCSPSVMTLSLDAGDYTLGYYCHTPQDQCVNDSDCIGQAGNACVYLSANGYWGCVEYIPPS